MSVIVKKIDNKEVWEDFLIHEKNQCNFLHSWNWGEVHRLLKRKIFRFGFYQKNILKGICLLIKQKARRGNYLECPGGPIIDWQQKIYFKSFIKLLKEVAGKENSSFVRLRTQLPNSPKNQEKFKNSGFIQAPMHLHAQDTWVLDITKDESTLLKGMRKTTRYLIRKAEKEAMRVEQNRNFKDIKILYRLQAETARRHNFIPFPLDFLEAHFEAFIKDGGVKIFKVLWKKQVYACALIVFYGERAVYHYSASSTASLKTPASYLLQWEAIKEAKKRGCKIYDFWGIAPENASEKHRFAGVTLFKKGFGGYPISYLPAQDLPLRWNHWFIYFFEIIRKKWRNL